MLIAPRNRLPNRGWSTPKNGKKLSAKKRAKKSSIPKRGLKQGNRPKPEPKRPTKQGMHQIVKSQKWTAPKMIPKGHQSTVYFTRKWPRRLVKGGAHQTGNCAWNFSQPLWCSFRKILSPINSGFGQKPEKHLVSVVKKENVGAHFYYIIYILYNKCEN
jgi:hypothetical protein